MNYGSTALLLQRQSVKKSLPATTINMALFGGMQPILLAGRIR